MAPHTGERDLYDEVASILEQHDPMGIMPESPDPELGPMDEYDPESTTIAARVANAHSREDVHRAVAEEFARWFEPGAAPAEVLTRVAEEIWAVVEEWRAAR